MTVLVQVSMRESTLIARLMGPTWGPTWVLSSPGGPHVGPINLAIWVCLAYLLASTSVTRTRATRPKMAARRIMMQRLSCVNNHWVTCQIARAYVVVSTQFSFGDTWQIRLWFNLREVFILVPDSIDLQHILEEEISITGKLMNGTLTIPLITFCPRTKWSPFHKRHLQMHFHERKLRISLKFVPYGHKSAMVQVMAWYLRGDKPIPELNADTVHWCI